MNVEYLPKYIIRSAGRFQNEYEVETKITRRPRKLRDNRLHVIVYRSNYYMRHINVHHLGSTRVLLLAWCLAAVVECSFAQDFSLCSTVDAKARMLTLGWTKPDEPVDGYSFFYNGYEVAPYRPMVDNPNQLSYQEKVRAGTHVFKLQGYRSELASNEVAIELRAPQYYTLLIPGLYQALYNNRYATSCQENRLTGRDMLNIAKPLALGSAGIYSTLQWFRFFKHKNAALSARQAYLDTIRIDELERWHSEKDKAQDVFKIAMTASIATLSANLITAVFMSPRGRARVKGGFNLDCSSHPDSINLCVKL